MPKDFFDIVNSYDPTKDVVDLAMKKFQMDNEKAKFDMVKSEFDKKQQMDAEELASKNEFMTGLKSMFTPGGTTKPATFGMDSPQAQSGLDAITQPEMTIPKPQPTAQDIMKLAISKGYNVDKFLPALVTAQKGSDSMPFASSPLGIFHKGTGEVVKEAPGGATNSNIAKPSPKDFTPESLAEYAKTGNMNVLKRVEPKLPVGFEKTEDGNLRPIPGSKYDIEQQNKYNAAMSRNDRLDFELGRLEKSATKLLGHKGRELGTGKSGVFNFVPGTSGYDFKIAAKQLGDMMQLDTMTAMREASKTGGLMGNLSDKEGEVLRGYIANLDNLQTEEQYKEWIEGIIQYSKDVRTRSQDALKKQFETADSNKSKPSSLPTGAKMAPDGFYYVPDPDRKGKYLKVE
jgi:hypothetical protein